MTWFKTSDRLPHPGEVVIGLIVLPFRGESLRQMIYQGNGKWECEDPDWFRRVPDLWSPYEVPSFNREEYYSYNSGSAIRREPMEFNMRHEIEGLPEGVDLIRFGVPDPTNETEALFVDGRLIMHGALKNRFGAIVKLQPGSEWYYDAANDRWEVIRKYAAPKVVVVRFTINSANEENRLREFLSTCGIGSHGDY